MIGRGDGSPGLGHVGQHGIDALHLEPDGAATGQHDLDHARRIIHRVRREVQRQDRDHRMVRTQLDVLALDAQHAVEDDEAELNVTINTTPLVDVMLVMLIIFLVTIPVINKTVPLELPTYRNIVTQTKPENIVISVTDNEDVFYNNEPVDQATMRRNFVDALRAAQAAGIDFPEVHIRGDRNVRFEAIGRVILACQQAGIQKVGFITEPHALDASSY